MKTLTTEDNFNTLDIQKQFTCKTYNFATEFDVDINSDLDNKSKSMKNSRKSSSYMIKYSNIENVLKQKQFDL